MTDFFAPGLDTVAGSNAGAPMKIALPAGGFLKRQDGTEVELVMYGPDSEKCRALVRTRRRNGVKLAELNLDADGLDDQQESLDLDMVSGMVKS